MPTLAATCIPTLAVSRLQGSIPNKEYFLLLFSLEQRSGTLCRARKKLFMQSTETTKDRSVIISLVGQDGASNMADQVPQELLDPNTPAEVIIRLEARKPETDPKLGIPVPPPEAKGANNRLVVLGRCLSHGFHSVAIFKTDLPYPAIIARNLA